MVWLLIFRALLFQCCLSYCVQPCLLARQRDSNPRDIARAWRKVGGRLCHTFTSKSSSGMASRNWSHTKTSIMVAGASEYASHINLSMSSANSGRPSPLLRTQDTLGSVFPCSGHHVRNFAHTSQMELLFHISVASIQLPSGNIYSSDKMTSISSNFCHGIIELVHFM